ncbi:MFS transporter [Sphingomonas sp. Leaf339]|uniref:MFS transporter n=1 Tax=Sphingomonas sp. Leaf339 TaxID=1736343 RepID=UPI0006F2B7C9|nr:MFS transporter [Sphingomonas sp. Leaf339]KQU46972.1 MFS transporter [Sphingomonas sp. Leaf339]
MNERVIDRPFGRAVPGLLVLGLAMAVGFAQMGSFSTVQEGAKAELGLSDVTLGLIQGGSAAVPLVLFSIPIGILVDRWNRMRLLLLFSAVAVCGSLLTAIAGNVPTLFVARMMTGIATTGGLTAALSLAADMCAPAQRGRAMLLVTLGKSLGVACAFALVGWLFGLFSGGFTLLGTGLPWRATHIALAAVAALASLPLLLLAEPVRLEVAAGPRAAFRVVAHQLWARRAFLIPLFMGQVSVVMADAAAGIWAAPMLTRYFHLTPQQFGGWMGALLLGTGVIGALLGGIVADLGQNSGRRGGLLIGAVGAAVIGIPAALFPLSGSVPVFAIALGTLMLAGTITGLITSVAITVMLPNDLRGLCLGAFIAFAGLIGYGLAPPLVGWVSLLLGGEQHLAISLTIVGVTTSIAALGSFYIAMRRAPMAPTDHYKADL